MTSSGVGTCLYGRRMYEVMRYWETASLDGESPAFRDFAAIWRAQDKIVYSATLQAVSSARTRIERRFDPDAVRALKQREDVSISGPGLATSAMRAGLVDEYRMYMMPVVIGSGLAAFPVGVRTGLTLIQERSFTSGAVYLRYRVRGA